MAATGTLTVTTTQRRAGAVKWDRVTLAWVCDASGDVNTNPTSVRPGMLVQAKFVPNGGGTQPSDNYDVTLKDSDGADLLGGGGANRSNAAAQLVKLDPEPLHDGGTLDLVVTNAGNAKGGTVVLLVRTQ